MKRKIVTGLASFGMSGKVFHAPLLSSHHGFRLKTIVERSKNEARSIYPDVEVVCSFDDLLNDGEIDLIIINTPDHTHAEFVHKALMADKHVIVEKPFTQHVSEAEDLLNLASKKKKLLSVFHNRRWDGDFLTVQKIIQSEALGRLVEFEAHFDRFRNYIQDSWKEKACFGTGTLYNLGSHLIDQALVLFGMPEAITADLRILREGGQVDDFFEVIMHYNDVRVALKATYLAKEPSPRYVLHGTKGSFVKYGIDPQEEALKNGRSPLEPDWGIEAEEWWGKLNTDNFQGKFQTLPGNYMAFYDNIYDVLVNNGKLAVKPQEAIGVIKVIEAALESSEDRITVEF
ncbi:MAG: oxidoreductase [Bacteroidota bacterium]|nr:oxidoreductase [Bacteroidota bacterium]